MSDARAGFGSVSVYYCEPSCLHFVTALTLTQEDTFPWQQQLRAWQKHYVLSAHFFPETKAPFFFKRRLRGPSCFLWNQRQHFHWLQKADQSFTPALIISPIATCSKQHLQLSLGSGAYILTGDICITHCRCKNVRGKMPFQPLSSISAFPNNFLSECH